MSGAGGPPPSEGAAHRAAPSLAFRRELARKSIHLTSATLPIAYALGVPPRVALAALLALAAVALGVEAARHRAPAARALFTRCFGTILREHEHEHLSGATWMLLAFALAVALLPRAAAVAAMWSVSVGDAAAAVVGRWAAARRRTPPGRKTLDGTLACFAAAAAGALLVARLPAGVALPLAAAAALAERVALPLDDNLRIVLAVAAAWALLALVGVAPA